MLSRQVLGKGSVLLLSLLGVGAASVLTVKQAPKAVFAVCLFFRKAQGLPRLTKTGSNVRLSSKQSGGHALLSSGGSLHLN